MRNILEYLNECLESGDILSIPEMICEADNSWGEQFESIICEAWNSGGKSLGEYTELVRKKGLNPDEVCENIYTCLSKVQLLSPDDKLHKLDNVPAATDEWKELGMYKDKNPNTTPKTDIISNEKGNCRISVKEATGARLMSGAINETIATIRVAISKSNDKALQDFADSIFQKLTGDEIETRTKIKGTTSAILKKLKLRENPQDAPEDEDELKIWKIERAKEELAALIEKIKLFPDAYDALLREAITGEVKFGENNPACADYVLTWDRKGNCEVYTTDDYIQKFGKDYKVYATYKSSSNKVAGVKDGTRSTWMVMTISN